MKYMTVNQVAIRWGISEQQVRRYCREGRIKGTFQKNGIWYITEVGKKPKRKKYKKQKQEIQAECPSLLNMIRKQRTDGYYKGLYDYIQINMSYSNNRMASGRMTRNQIELLYQQNKIETANEVVRVNDVIEARNSFLCLDYLLDEAMTPLSRSLILELHRKLRSDTVGSQRLPQEAGTFRVSSKKLPGRAYVAPLKIGGEVDSLFFSYESQKKVGLEEIIDMHVRFEQIRPFDDCNGRIGRLLIFKECLRHSVTPFIIDDKRRGDYLKGLACWDTEKECLLDLCKETQKRFLAFMEASFLMELNEREKRCSKINQLCSDK
ncbi:MAG: Fic family protein [Faecousia sp.]